MTKMTTEIGKAGASLWEGEKLVASLGFSESFTNESDLDDGEVLGMLERTLLDAGYSENGRGGWEK